MAYNKIFADLPTDLHTIICKYNRNVIYALSKERLFKYNWKYLIKAVFGASYDLPIDEMMMMYDSLSKSKNVCCGFVHTIIRCTDGTLMACGSNETGQLGLGDTKEISVFEVIKGIPTNVVDVVCGDEHTIIRCTDGTLMACGNNRRGQLGLGDTECRQKFEEIKGIPKNVVDIVCGGYHTIIRLSDGTLMACGSNNYGQLGLGDTKHRSVFEVIKGIPKNVVGIVCGGYYTIIRLSDGTLMACGNNCNGQLGLGNTKTRLIFEEIKGVPKNIVDIACGYWHTIIRLSDGTLMACGDNYFGQLGLGDTKKRLVFEKVKGIPTNIVDIVCGDYHTIIKSSNMTLMSCGQRIINGQLSWDDRTYTLFKKIKDTPKNIVNIVCGVYHTTIRLSDGILMAYGSNKSGQLGFGDNEDRMVFEVIKKIPKNC